jgi:opacity protein-like surface antigen
MLASAQRQVTGSSGLTTRDYASFYLTPGIRVKFHPQGRIQPFAAIGGGLAWYENSVLTLNGAANNAPRELFRGAFTFGGGADVPLRRWLALRAEVRDFYTGNPGYNVAVSGSGQHNVTAGGGFVLFFGK